MLTNALRALFTNPSELSCKWAKAALDRYQYDTDCRAQQKQLRAALPDVELWDGLEGFTHVVVKGNSIWPTITFCGRPIEGTDGPEMFYARDLLGTDYISCVKCGRQYAELVTAYAGDKL